VRAVLARLATPILQQLAAQAPSDDARYREHAGAGKLLRIDADRDGGDFFPFFWLLSCDSLIEGGHFSMDLWGY